MENIGATKLTFMVTETHGIITLFIAVYLTAVSQTQPPAKQQK